MAARRNARICENNHIVDATLTASAAVGFPISNVQDGKRRGKVFRSASNSFTIQIDLKAAKQVSFIGIFGESNKVFGISAAATITLKANSINYFVGTVPYSKTIPVTDAGAFADLTDDTYEDGYQYRFYQLIIDDSTNPDPVEISYLYLGDHVDFTFNVNSGFQFTQIDLSRRTVSDSGVVYSAKKNQYAAFTGMGFSYLDADDRAKLQQAIARIGLTNPFVFVLDPLQIGFEYEFGCIMAYFEELPRLTHAYLNKFNVAFSLREVV